jgi:uncharacterized membrane protein
MRKWLVLLLLIVLLPGTVVAQSDIPVVYGVFFYSPTCPHCHKVMEDDLPRMAAEFGDQWQLLFVNVSAREGSLLFQSAYNAPDIPVNGGSVPTLVIGNQVMVGSAEIPDRAFDIIRDGLATGGIGLPNIPGLREAYSANLAGATQTGVADYASVLGAVETDTFDLADAIAATVLALLSGSILVVGAAIFRRLRGWNGQGVDASLPRMAALSTALLGIFVGLTLAYEAWVTPLVLVVALVEIAALAAVAYALFKARKSNKTLQLPRWLLPVSVVGGLAVAGYLSYIELTQSDAVCGLVGECNLVQQSGYARLFGILPIGVFGIVGYLLILALWFVSRRSQSKQVRSLLLAAALFGVIFSIYLTVLEIFVINAVCMWCISSALISLLILWLVAGEVWEKPKVAQRLTYSQRHHA